MLTHAGRFRAAVRRRVYTISTDDPVVARSSRRNSGTAHWTSPSAVRCKLIGRLDTGRQRCAPNYSFRRFAAQRLIRYSRALHKTSVLTPTVTGKIKYIRETFCVRSTAAPKNRVPERFQRQSASDDRAREEQQKTKDLYCSRYPLRRTVPTLRLRH